jgi:hypothetical protein
MKKLATSLLIALSLVGGIAHAQSINTHFLESFNASPNYRELVDKGLKEPARGGSFYAIKVLSQCQSIADLQSRWAESVGSRSEDSQTDARSNAIKLLATRCGSFTEMELSQDSINRLINSSAEKDPLLAAARSYTQSRNLRTNATLPERRTEAVASAVRFKDPLVVDDLGLRLILVRDQTTKATSYKINGQSIQLDDKLDPGLAMYLVPCEIGLKCDETEFTVALPCASQGICDAGRYDKVKKMTEKSGADYEGIVRLAKTIAQTLSDGTQGGNLLK